MEVAEVFVEEGRIVRVVCVLVGSGLFVMGSVSIHKQMRPIAADVGGFAQQIKCVWADSARRALEPLVGAYDIRILCDEM